MLNEDYKEILQTLLNKESLIKNQQSTGREKDKLDADYLKRDKKLRPAKGGTQNLPCKVSVVGKVFYTFPYHKK